MSKSEEGKGYVITARSSTRPPRQVYETGERRGSRLPATALRASPIRWPSARAHVTPKPIDRRRAAGRGRRPGGRGNLSRQVRPRQGAVLLGPRGQEATTKARAGSASRRTAPARTGASSHPPHRPGSAWSASWKATPTGPSSPAESTTPTRCRPIRCPARRRKAASSPTARPAAAAPTSTLRRHQGQRADPRARTVRQGLDDRARPPRTRQARPPSRRHA